MKHRFPDTAGTLWDQTGRFRVLLQVTNRTTARSTWVYAPVVVTNELIPASPVIAGQPGLAFRYVESEKPALPELVSNAAVQGVAAGGLALDGVRQRDENYALAFAGYVDSPLDGGYVLALKGTDAGRIRIDGRTVTELPAAPFAQVCGLAGNAVRWSTGTIALARGQHRIEVEETHGAGLDGFGVLWQTPGTSAMVAIPESALSHGAARQ